MTSFVAVGDLMLGDSANTVGYGLRSAYPADALEQVLDGLSPLLAEGDVVLGNLECPLTEKGVGRTRLARDQMRGEPNYARLLRRVGFNTIAVANNHAMQHGRSAFWETVQALRDAGMQVVGLRGSGDWVTEPVKVPVGPLGVVGLLGYSWRPRQYDLSEPLYAEGDPASVLADISRLRPSVDRLVVSLHWGDEFVGYPSQRDRQFAQAATEAGADVIVGHHPHVVRPIEAFKSSIVAYSLGNAVSDMVWWEPLRLGSVLRVSLEDMRAAQATVRIDDDYRTRATSSWTPVPSSPAHSTEDAIYSAQVSSTLRTQRIAAYTHAVRNLLRFPPRVGAELMATTLLNKASSFLGRS